MATGILDSHIGLINPLAPDFTSWAGHSGGSSPGPEQWDHVTDELLRLRTLEDDWDGQGAVKPAPANVDAALNWLGQMRGWDRSLCPTKVAAGVDGEVHFVWQNPSLYLDAEISSPKSVAWLLSVKGQDTRQWQTELSQTWIVGALD